MTTRSDHTLQIQACVDRLLAGDETARTELLNCACDRLTRLTRTMLKGFPRVHRWEQTDDVMQNAIMRLFRTLEQIKPPTAADFLRLAALNIRRELLDLARKYYGAQGLGAHHASVAEKPDADGATAAFLDRADTAAEPAKLSAWTLFHQEVDRLPEEERAIFDLLWYQGLSQDDAAALLNISTRTLKRRWQSARLRLYEALDGELPA